MKTMMFILGLVCGSVLQVGAASHSVTASASLDSRDFSITVRSANPVSGVAIGGSQSGSTTYTRYVPWKTTVTLTAPLYHGRGVSRKKFKNWTGHTSSSSRSISVLVTSTVDVTAVFTNAPVVKNDFNDDGRSDIGYFVPSSGIWRMKLTGGSSVVSNSFGYAGTVPVTGDFDGDGLVDYGCYDAVGIPGSASPGSWYFMMTQAGFQTRTFGYNLKVV